MYVYMYACRCVYVFNILHCKPYIWDRWQHFSDLCPQWEAEARRTRDARSACTNDRQDIIRISIRRPVTRPTERPRHSSYQTLEIKLRPRRWTFKLTAQNSYSWTVLPLSSRQSLQLTGLQGRSQDFTLGPHKLSAEGAERGEDWREGVPLPNRLGSLGERRELP